MNIIRRVLYGFRLFWYGMTHYQLFELRMFTVMSKVMEAALKASSENRPYTTHLFLGEKRIVSLWMYPGMSTTPVDRIEELAKEVEALKEAAQEFTTRPACKP